MNRVCVRCTSVLDNATVSGVEVDLCPSCGGLWLDAGELERIGKSDAKSMGELQKSLKGSATPEPPSETQTSCPACSAELKQTKVGSVTVDFCTTCKGVFLDKGELDEAVRVTAGASFADVVAAAATAAHAS